MQHIYIHIPFVARIWQSFHVKHSAASVCKNINTRYPTILSSDLSIHDHFFIINGHHNIFLAFCDNKAAIDKRWTFALEQNLMG